VIYYIFWLFKNRLLIYSLSRLFMVFSVLHVNIFEFVASIKVSIKKNKKGNTHLPAGFVISLSTVHFRF